MLDSASHPVSERDPLDRKVLGLILVTALLLSAILLLPFPYRDVLLVAAVIAATGVAFVHFEIAWLGLLALYPLIRLSGGLFHVAPFWVTRFVIVLWVGLYLVKYWDLPSLRHVLRAKGLVFFGVFILANVVSAVSILRIDSLLVAFTYLEPLFFFAITYLLVRRKQTTPRRVLQALLLGGFIVVGVGLVEMGTQRSIAAILNPALKRGLDVAMYGWQHDRFGLGGRISSLIGQPTSASLYFVVVMILAIYYALTYQRTRLWLSLAALFGATCVLVCLATGTRAGVLALGVALVLLSILGPKRNSQRLLVLGGLVAFAILVFVFVPTFHEYIVASLDFAGESEASRNITGRWALTMELLRIFREHWFLGYGPGQVQKQAVAGILPTVPGIKSLGGIENQYATILADGGVVAGLAYLSFMVAVGWQIYQMMRQARWRPIGLTLLALFAAYFVFVATETALTAIAFVLLMAIFGAFTADFESANENPLPRGQ